MSGQEETRYKKKKKLGSYPFISVIFSITLALFVIGLFGLLLLHAQKLTQAIRNNIEVQIYLDKYVSENNIVRLQNILSNAEYIARTDEEPEIRFISSEEAARQFTGDTGEDFTDFLGDNPLRDAFVIRIDPRFQDTTSLAGIKTDIERLQGVFEVTYMESLVNAINQNMAKISLVLLGFAVILLIIVVILINNTIKLALFSQRFLIRSMQLVGARPGFIRWPFLRRSLGHGFFSGILAVILLYILLNYANKQVDGLADLQNNSEIIVLFAGVVILGALIGFLSTYRSIRKYLKMSLDELY